MKEILQFQVGQCGNQSGTKFWEFISGEHGIDASGRYIGSLSEQCEKMGVFFNEGMGSRFSLRALLVDLEPGIVDSVRASHLGKLFKLENYALGQTGAGNNWAKGHYTEGPEIVDYVMDGARREIQECDSFQGSQIVHSVSGGTGGGLGTLILAKMREEYANRSFTTFSVISNPGTTDSIVSPYNALLSLHQMIENADTCTIFDNRSLYGTYFKHRKNSLPSYGDLNRVVAQAMAGITCPWRFRTGANCDLLRTSYNLVPYPRYHFLIPSCSPIGAPMDEEFRPLEFFEHTNLLFRPDNTLCDTDITRGRCLAAVAVYQGRNAKTQTNLGLLSPNRRSYLNWPNVPDNIKLSSCNISPKVCNKAVTLLSNSTAIRYPFQQLREQFEAIFKRKAFLHWYLGEGMDQMEFTEAASNLTDLIDEYEHLEQDEPQAVEE